MRLPRLWLALVCLVAVLARAEEPQNIPAHPSLRLTVPQAPTSDPLQQWDSYEQLRFHPFEQRLDLDGRFYRSDSVKAALAALPADVKLGPPDIADDGWKDRMEALADYSRAIGRTPRFNAEIAGLKCAGGGLLFMTCKVPDSSCAFVVALIVILGGCGF